MSNAGPQDDEMLLHLNLIHEGDEFMQEYEKNSYQYFKDIQHDGPEESKSEESGEVGQDQVSSTDDKTVDYLFVVGFDHKIGSIIEYFYPEADENVIDEETKKSLSFIGLPDGSHSVDSDYSFFIIPDAQGNLFYGVSWFRQIKSSELEVKDKNVSRSFVQKSVCVLSRVPIFATLMVKLLPTTHAYFCQKNFSDTKILEEFFGSTNQIANRHVKYTEFYHGFDLKRIVIFMKQNILTVLKLMLMEGKVMVYSQKASKVCTFVLTLISLLPSTMNFNYEDSDRVQAVLNHYKAYGLPLKLFNSKCLFLPLSTLNDLDALSECKGFVVGCTNKLLAQYPSIKLDWVINLDENTTEFRQTELSKIARNHTSMEKNFINSLLKQLKELAVNLTTEQMYCWDSTDQSNMPDIESLDHADLCAKNAFGLYFKQLLCRMAFAEIWAKEHEIPNSSIAKPIKRVVDESEKVFTQEEQSAVLQEQSSEPNDSKVEQSPVQIEEEKLDQTADNTRGSVVEGTSPEPKPDVLPAVADFGTEEDDCVVVNDMSNYNAVLNLLKDYNLKFIKQWSRTYNFHKWKKEHHPNWAYLDSGVWGKNTIDFFKLLVSLKHHF